MRSQRLPVILTALNLVLLLGLATRPPSADAQSAAPVLRVRSLELVDGPGRVRARLSVESNQEVVFRLLDHEGTIRVKLGAAKDGSGIVLLNDATEVGIHLLAKGTGTSLTLRGSDGRERVLTP